MPHGRMVSEKVCQATFPPVQYDDDGSQNQSYLKGSTRNNDTPDGAPYFLVGRKPARKYTRHCECEERVPG